jgi:uncharacterized protein YjdB
VHTYAKWHASNTFNTNAVKNRKTPNNAVASRQTIKTPSKSIESGKQLSFIENKGQVKDQFNRPRTDLNFKLSGGKGLNIFVGNGKLIYQFSSEMKNGKKSTDTKNQSENEVVTNSYPGFAADQKYIMHRLEMTLLGTNDNATIETGTKETYHENYYTSANKTTGTTCYSYNRVTYKDIYPNIDWVLYVENGQLKHEFEVHEGGNPNNIKLAYGGATSLRIADDGKLMAGTTQGTITEDAPYCFQQDGRTVKSKFKINGNIVQYETDAFSGNLTIDPGLSWATYYGGSEDERGYAMVMDDEANVYITGLAQSSAGIATVGAYQTVKTGSGNDAMLVKFNSSGTRLWATYYGGEENDNANAIAMDGSGNLFIGGLTGSTGNIASSAGHQTSYGGNFDGFLAKFNNSGNLLWSTYYGGAELDNVNSVVVDGSGNAFICGQTQSSSAISTSGAYQTTFGAGGSDAFLAKFNSAGVRLWGTYYGAGGNEFGSGAATDAAGNVYITGFTGSTTGIATTGAHQSVHGGGIYDAYVVKFNTGGERQWGTYFGSTGNEEGNYLTISNTGNIYLTGYTTSTGLATTGAHQTSFAGSSDVLLLKMTTEGVLQWSTYYGGTGSEEGNALVLDDSETIYLTGSTMSTSGIATADGRQTTAGGANDAFLATFTKNGTRVWATYFGGTNNEIGRSVGVDSLGSMYLTGLATSATGIATSGAFQTVLGGTGDMFLAKFYGLPPTITAVTPGIANPETEVTITGTNFNSVPSNNIVYFGATRAVVNTGTTTSLTVTVPIGTTFMPVSLNNTASSLVAFSPQPFLHTYDNFIYMKDSINFNGSVDFVTGTDPRHIALGDLDGDGKTDIAVVNNTSNTVSVYRNTSSSGTINSTSFAAPVDFATETAPVMVAIADIDGDTKPDLVCANSGPSSFSVFKNTSTTGTINSTSFSARVNFAVGGGVRDIAFNDLDADGKTDIVIVVQGSHNISVFKNRSVTGYIETGSFAPKVDFSTGTSPFGVVVTDIDGDKKPDIAVANQGVNAVSVFRNTTIKGVISTGSFAAKKDFRTGTAPKYIAAADIDGDGKPELVTGNNAADSISVFRNNATTGFIDSSSFDTKTDFATGDGPLKIEVADFNGDGKPDLAIINNNSNTVSLLRNTATTGAINSATFAPADVFGTGNQPTHMAAGDLDGDMRPDLAIVNFGSDNMNILRNNPLLERPVIYSISPNPGIPGNTVTVTGANFNTTPSNNILFFGATQAVVSAATNGTITATIPTGATHTSATLLNTAFARMASSPVPFLPTFNNGSYVQGVTNFAPKVSYTSADAPTSPVIADIDLDGKPDMIVANRNANSISVFRNTSTTGLIATGSFAAKVDFATGSQPTSIAIADIDLDGKPDILVTNQGANSLSILRNTATSGSVNSGSLALKVDFTTGDSPAGLAVGDVDGDGKPDIAVANNNANTISVFRNTAAPGTISTASLAAKTDFTAGSNPVSITFADFDADGKADIAVANSADNSLSVFRNTSIAGNITTSAFTPRTDFPTGIEPSSIVAIDIDNDGKPDLVAANRNANTISVIRNTAASGIINSSSFAAKVDFATGSKPQGNIGTGDLDGDGKPDLAIANFDGNTVTVLRNTGTAGVINAGSLAPKVDFVTELSTNGVAIGDLDNDNLPELATTNTGNNKIAVLKNNPLLPIAGTISVCQGQTGTLTNGTPNGLWSSANTAIATVGTVTGIVTGIGAGTVQIRYTVAGGQTSVIATINAIPDASFTVSPNPVTPGVPAVFSNTDPLATIYNWSFGDGSFSTLNNVSHTYTTSAVYSPSLTVTTSNGCSATASGIVTSGVSQTGLNLDGNNDHIVIGSPLPSGSSYTKECWVFVTALSGTRDLISSADARLYISGGMLTAGQGGSSAVVADITPFPLNMWTHVALTYEAGTNTMKLYRNGNLVATNTAAPPFSGSAAFVGSLDGSSGFLQGTIDEVRIWNSVRSSTDILANMSCDVAQHANLKAYYRLNQGIPTGINTHLLSVYDYSGNNNCGIALNMTMSGSTSNYVTGIVAGCNSISEPAVTGSLTMCPGSTTLLSASISGGIWTSSDTVIATVNPSSGLVTAPGPSLGTAIISYTTGSNCTIGKVVTVGALSPNTGIPQVCLGQPTAVPILFNDAPGGTWSSSNTAKIIISPSSGAAKGMSAGSAVITYMTGSGCFATTIVTVLAAVNNITGAVQVCPGSTTLFSNTTTGGEWQSSNTDIAAAGTGGVITGLTGGSVVISYFVSAGCYKTKNLTVLPTITPITGPDVICPGPTVNYVSGPAGGTWSSSNTTKATINTTSGLASGIAAGTSIITYKLSNGCFLTRTITVNSTVATITGTTNICPGTSASLACTTPGGTWLSSNIAKATIDNAAGIATGLSSGTTTISYVVSPACYRTTTLTVLPVPTTITGTAACVGSGSSLASSPAGGSWSSSNTSNATINAVSGSVWGLTEGTSTISYTLSNSCFTTRVVTVNSTPSGILGSPNACISQTTLMTCTPEGGLWSSSNTVKASIDATAGLLIGLTAGTTNITYTLPTGCYRKVTVSVNPLPATIAGPGVVCTESFIALSNTTGGGTWSSSNTGVATITSVSGVLTGVGDGTVTVSYQLGNGCTTTRQITVNPIPSGLSGPVYVCLTHPTPLTATPADGSWSSSNATIATVSATGAVTGMAIGTAFITYTLPTGCYKKITAHVVPSPAPITGPGDLNIGASATFSSATSGGAWSSADTDIVHIHTASGIGTGINVGITTLSYHLSTGCYVTKEMVVNVATSGKSAVIANSALYPRPKELFTMFPNPTNGILTITANNPGSLKIYALDSKQLLHVPILEGLNSVMLPGDIVPGTYIASFLDVGGRSEQIPLVVFR